MSRGIPFAGPRLVRAPKAIDGYGERLLEFAHAMVRAETLRRRKATGV